MAAIAAQGFAQSPIAYPKTKTVNQVDEYFGVKVADPYRWLEDDNSAETAAWVEAENKVTQDYISKIPFRNALKEKMMKLQNYEKMGIPFKHHGKYFFYKNNGLQNQSVLYEMDSLDGTPREVLDPNKLSDDGTVALKSVDFSKDGRYMAYTISRSGSDWNEIYVKDMKDGKMLDDHIVWAKFTNASWQGDGFYYSAYDAPKSELSSKNEYQKVYYHKLGTPQSQDELVFRSFEEPLMFHMPFLLRVLTAFLTSPERWRRCRNANLSSLNVCAPMLTRFIPSDAIRLAYSSVMSSGLHSMVNSSILYIRCGRSCRAVHSLLSDEGLSSEGVPPPMYIVLTGSEPR